MTNKEINVGIQKRSAEADSGHVLLDHNSTSEAKPASTPQTERRSCQDKIGTTDELHDLPTRDDE